MTRTVTIFAIAVVLSSGPLVAQQRPPQPTPQAVPPPVTPAAPPSTPSTDVDAKLKALSSLGKPDGDYRVGPGDLLEVSVFGVDEFVTSFASPRPARSSYRCSILSPPRGSPSPSWRNSSRCCWPTK